MTPVDVEHLFLPVLGHRVVFTPKTLADARRAGWETMLHEFRSSCLSHVQPPATVFEADGNAAPR